MLNVTGMNRFYYLRNFHDMRCKYERVLSIIHQQLNREPQEDEVFIVMSKDRSVSSAMTGARSASMRNVSVKVTDSCSYAVREMKPYTAYSGRM